MAKWGQFTEPTTFPCETRYCIQINTDYPKFRSKKDNQYFIVPSRFNVNKNRLVISKFQGGIKYRDKSPIPENIKQIIITKDVDRYYASIQYEIKKEIPKGTGTVGIDMGIKSFITT